MHWDCSLYNILYCIYLSACLLQKQSVDYARVQEYSLRVLQWRPGDIKALYRAGVATLEMGDAQTAKQYLTKACIEKPNGKKIGTTLGWTTATYLEQNSADSLLAYAYYDKGECA